MNFEPLLRRYQNALSPLACRTAPGVERLRAPDLWTLAIPMAYVGPRTLRG